VFDLLLLIRLMHTVCVFYVYLCDHLLQISNSTMDWNAGL